MVRDKTRRVGSPAPPLRTTLIGTGICAALALSFIADTAVSSPIPDGAAPATSTPAVEVGTTPAPSFASGSPLAAAPTPPDDSTGTLAPATLASTLAEPTQATAATTIPGTTVEPATTIPETTVEPATTIPETTVEPAPTPPALAVVPGLAGYGTTTPAGRGGQVLRVTTLADDGPGSLREAITTTGPRTIVFEVGGTIRLESALIAVDPYFTVAGQTAPDPGITIAGYQVSIRTHDVLIQHVRVRAGDLDGGDPEGISLYQPGGREVHDIVIDHTSTSWAIDENTNTWSATAADEGPHAGVHDVTFSNNLITEALDNSTHPEGPHSKGMLVGDGSERIAVLRNVFVNNADRSPEMTGGTSAVVVNNLVYGWNPKQEATHFGRAGSIPDEPTCAAVVSNVYLRSALMRRDPAAAIEIHRDLPPASRLYIAGNLAPRLEMIRNESAQDPLVADAPLWPEGLEVIPAVFLTEGLLARAGSRPAGRDAVDRRVVSDVYAGTGSIIDTQSEVGGWPELAPTSRPLDLPSDPAGDADADGYTDLEEYLHELARIVEGRPVVSVSDADTAVSSLHLSPPVAEQPCVG